MPAREPRLSHNAMGKKYRTGDTRSLDSTKPLEPFKPVVVENLNQLRVSHEFEVGEGGTWELANTIHDRFKRVNRGSLNVDHFRRIVVDLATGEPQDWVTGNHHGLIPLEGAVTLYAVIEDITDPTVFRLVIIGTRKNTTFLFIKGDTAFFVDFAESSTSTIEAVANLYGTCLDKGADQFNSILETLPDLFYKLFAAVVDNPCQIDFKVWHTKGEEVNLRLYLYPNEPNRNILSGNGYCWHVHLSQFPSRHISRGYSLRKWEHGRKPKG